MLLPRWLAKAPQPDLVLVCFGGNDWGAGMRGGQFRETCEEAVERLRQATKGSADVLLLTTVPSLHRWTTMAELGEAVRAASRAKKAGPADTEKAFLAAGQEERAKWFVADGTHLSRADHCSSTSRWQGRIIPSGRKAKSETRPPT